MEQQRNTNRIAYLDMLRILATFSIILIHIFAEDYYNSFKEYDWYVNAIGNSLMRWGVPIFVMISGVLFLNPQKSFPIKRLYKKNISRLLIAFVFWGLFYSLFSAYQHYKYGMPIIYNGRSVFFKWSPGSHLWFLPMLMAVYALVPLLRKITNDTKLLKYTLALWCVYITGNLVLVKNIAHITPLFAMNVVIGCTGYFLLGHYLSQNTFQTKHRRIIYLLGILGAIIGIAGTLGISFLKGKPDDTFLGFYCPHTAMVAVALFVLLKELAPKLQPKVNGFVNHVRKDLFGIYLIHYFWLYAIDWEPVKNLCNYAISSLLIGICIFIISLYSIKLIRLIPILRKVVE